MSATSLAGGAGAGPDHPISGDSRLKTRRKLCGHGKRCANPGDASGPSEAVKQLAKHLDAYKAAQEIRGEIGPARHAAIITGCLPDEASRRGLRKERTGSDQNHAGQDLRKIRRISGRPSAATASALQIAGRVPKRLTALPASRVVTIE